MEIFFQVLFLIVIMPIIIFQEGSKMLADFLKKKNIYRHWDIWHSIILLIIIILFFAWAANGYR